MKGRRVISVVDSHTAGEPTRVVIDGGPELPEGTVSERCDVFRREYDHFRSAIVNEPRGSDVLVGALLCTPVDDANSTGVIFFNNVNCLGMCGHGLIGVVETLSFLGRIQAGRHGIETPVGTVVAHLDSEGVVSVENVPCFRTEKALTVDVPGFGRVTGDVAWGGNWFFLVSEPHFDLSDADLDQLTRHASAIRQAVNSSGFPEVDHVELFDSPTNSDANSKNFVLCPGNQYDRSPCGTGTSAKMACLAADQKLAPEQTWIQEGILGTTFECTYKRDDGLAEKIIPTVRGTAHVTAKSSLIIDQSDPFCWGIGAKTGSIAKAESSR